MFSWRGRRIIVTLLTIACVSSVCTSTASARVFNTPTFSEGEDYAFTENPDGTYTEYYKEGSNVVRGDTYSGEAAAEADRIARGAELDSGTTGQSASSMAGANANDEEYSKVIAEALEKQGHYVTEGERAVGDNLLTDAEAIKVLPERSILLDACQPECTLGVGAALLGIGIGTGIDELVGWPSLFEGELSEPYAAPLRRYQFQWYPEVEIEGPAKECGALEEPWKAKIVCATYDSVSQKRKRITEDYYLGEWGVLHEETGLLSKWSDSENWQQLGECPTSWVTCLKGNTYSQGYRLLAPTGSLPKIEAYPGPGLKNGSGVIKGASKEIKALSPITTPVPQPPPSTIKPITKTYIIEYTKLPDVEKEPTKIPGPLWPEIPEVHPNEVYTHYKGRLEEAGFPSEKIEKIELPENSPFISPFTGPGDVVTASPSPGSRVNPASGTTVKVEVNPSTSGIPIETPGGIGPPSLPGFKLPSFPVLCKGFPFGVPCWIAETIESWNTSAVAPEWGIENLEVDGKKITGKVKLSVLEPVMEKVRPAMLIFATIGLVLLFYNFAKGGGPPSGGNSDPNPMGYGESGGPGAEEEID